MKAYQEAQKTYGSDHFCSKNIFGLLEEQRNWKSDKFKTKATTEILNLKKKSQTLLVDYSWEEEIIIITLYKKQ